MFRCYEIKCTVSDFHSKASKTFLGNFNYYVLTQELYDQVKDEIPDWIGVYIYGDLVKKAKKQNIESHRPDYLKTSKAKDKTMVEILKDSMIRSLYREAGKLYDSGNDSLIQRKNRELSSYKSQLKSTKRKYSELEELLFRKFGSRYQKVIEEMSDKYR